jgi:hypothetical protein
VVNGTLRLRAQARRRLAYFLASPLKVHDSLQVLGFPELEIDPNVFRNTPDEEVDLLDWQKIRRVAHQCVEALLVFLERGVEG